MNKPPHPPPPPGERPSIPQGKFQWNQWKVITVILFLLGTFSVFLSYFDSEDDYYSEAPRQTQTKDYACLKECEDQQRNCQDRNNGIDYCSDQAIECRCNCGDDLFCDIN